MLDSPVKIGIVGCGAISGAYLKVAPLFDVVEVVACALRSGRRHRASGELTYHVLDLMHGFHDASDQGGHLELQSTCQRPAALPLGLPMGQLDE